MQYLKKVNTCWNARILQVAKVKNEMCFNKLGYFTASQPFWAQDMCHFFNIIPLS